MYEFSYINAANSSLKDIIDAREHVLGLLKSQMGEFDLIVHGGGAAAGSEPGLVVVVIAYESAVAEVPAVVFVIKFRIGDGEVELAVIEELGDLSFAFSLRQICQLAVTALSQDRLQSFFILR